MIEYLQIMSVKRFYSFLIITKGFNFFFGAQIFAREMAFENFKIETKKPCGQRAGTVEQARLEIFACIESYYARIRRHSSLSYVSPAEARKTVEHYTNKEQREFCPLFSCPSQ